MAADFLIMLCGLAGFFGPLCLITAILEATIWKDQ